ncbi:Lrp/AsnC ligand binding domain-containing protein [Streptomyces geranii]|uniref:Lrp/AsnC ligand binding domain-containing protein n=1 Tax=Streptomyces geranii TaxID=2058923 RepID=UPI000D0388E9|nr:Lrp/AsnC ligand binding domain-containing protein [Streptomyces geranii]
MAWNVLSGVLGSDAVTLSRRWARIERAGLAWITAAPGGPDPGGTLALVEFVCEPDAVLTAADAAAADAAICSIDLTAGRREFIATLVVRDDAELAEYALNRMGAIPGVRSVRTHVVNEMLRQGADWTVDTLGPTQRRHIPTPRPPRAGSAKRIGTALTADLCRLLSRNGRATCAALATELGISAQQVSDAIARLRHDGSLVLRTDVAACHSNWPIATWYFIQAPAATVIGARGVLDGMPTVQFAGSATGPFNLIVAAGARAKQEVLHLEAELELRLPHARIMDRSVVLRRHKHLGRLLDASGRANGQFVPLR